MIKRLIVFAVFGALIVGFTQTDFAHAATIAVDTTNMTNQADGNGVPSECSLPDALAAANTNVAVNGCVAGDPATSAVDAVVISSGLYDISQMVNPSLPNLIESTTIQGAGVGLTTIANGSVTFEPTSSVVMLARVDNLSLAGGAWLSVFMGSAAAAVNFDVYQLRLDGSYININHDGTHILTSTLSDISGINGSLFYIINQTATNPGDTTISNVSLDGGGGMGAGINHMNNLGNDKVYVRNSVVTNYDIGISNLECVPNYFAIGSLYVSNSSIGGGNMSVGVENLCGHLSVDSTTFHDIHGAAIYAQTNHMGVDDLFGVPTCHLTQDSSRIELTNNTFTSIDASSIDGGPAAVVSFDSALNPSCPSQSLTSDTTVLMQQNTFAGNVLGAFSNIAVMDGTVLKTITLQNNAFEGSAVLGDFSVSDTTVAQNNVSTASFSGPTFLQPAFRQVTSLLLSPLADNGGVARIGYSQTGGNVLTFRPQWGSPLIDGASTVGIETDQRGQTRALLRSYDVGSVEVTRGEVLGDGITAAALDAYLSSPSGRLAETGLSIYLWASAAAVLVAMGYALWVRQRTYPMSF